MTFISIILYAKIVMLGVLLNLDLLLTNISKRFIFYNQRLNEVYTF